jgi:hypothetical protein
LLVAPLTLVLLLLLVASAEACLSLPATSNWSGRWKSNFGPSGMWSASVTANQIGPMLWSAEGYGSVEIFGYGSAAGFLTQKLTCTSSTTDSQTGTWEDAFRDHVTTSGELAISSSAVVESGTYEGSTLASPVDKGHWEGEFHPTAPSRGLVPGTVEVESSTGTLINSLQTEVATVLPLLPSGDIAPVGGVKFAGNLPIGATIKVKLVLPLGSHPTNLFKLVNGTYVEVPATFHSGEAREFVEYEITDGGVFDEDHTANGEVVDPVVPASHGLQVRSGTLPEATRGMAYSVQLVASGGTAPYKWKKVGKLPKGLKLTHAGVIQGVPSTKLAPRSYRVGVQVSDSEKPKQSASGTLALTVK